MSSVRQEGWSSFCCATPCSLLASQPGLLWVSEEGENYHYAVILTLKFGKVVFLITWRIGELYKIITFVLAIFG